MENLESKYRNGTLTGDELAELREKVNAATDMELEQLMSKTWNEYDMDTADIDRGQSEWLKHRSKQLKRRIDLALEKDIPQKRHLSLWMRYGQVAAAILLPLFMAWSFWLYQENNRLIANETVISTAEGERAGITLPDGSKITLNSMSRLSYHPKAYNKTERNIHFEGEGYFQICKNPKAPFIIGCNSLQVEVLGTTFNLSVRHTETSAELALEEGSVLLTAACTQQSIVMQPNEKAIINQQTGDITIIRNANVAIASAWRHGELVFRNSPLKDVLHSLENNYKIHFHFQKHGKYANNTFTGTLPTNNLNEALEVIELSYGLRASIRENEVLLE